jgi:hypothetical protein
MKKLAVLMMIPALAMFMVPALASADDHGDWGAGHGIKGLYAVTGFSTCMPTGPGIFEGDYTFHNDGTGTAVGWVRMIVPCATCTNPTTTGIALGFSLAFTYKVDKLGKIAFYYDQGFELSAGVIWDQGPSHGAISPDGKTITITCGPPKVLTQVQKGNTGIKANCVTSAVGIRLNGGDRDERDE